MRRITLFLTVAAIVAVMMSISASPAMAQTFFVGGSDFDHFDRDHFVGDVGPAGQEFSIRDIRSGAANPRVDISNAGDNVNLAPAVQQTVNTGNVLNEQGVVSGPGTTGFNDCVDIFGNLVSCGFIGGFDGIDGFGTFGGDVDLVGPTLTVGGDLNSTATQTIEQAAAA